LAQEYVDSEGRVPRGLTEISAAQQMRFILLMRLVLQLGGKVEIQGMGTPEEINDLTRNHELKVSGSGHGSIIIEVVRK
jgi:hypothetical protein